MRQELRLVNGKLDLEFIVLESKLFRRGEPLRFVEKLIFKICSFLVKREYLKKHLKLIHNVTDADYNVYERIDEENKTKKP